MWLKKLSLQPLSLVPKRVFADSAQMTQFREMIHRKISDAKKPNSGDAKP